MKILLYLIISCVVCCNVLGEPAAIAPKGLTSYSAITGFHSHFDKKSGFEYRILEVDGSSSVAMNPISLYLVVTNNLSGDDLQSRVLVLPNVSKIKKIRFSEKEPTIFIDAVFARYNKNGKSEEVMQSIKVAIPIKSGSLGKLIDVTMK